MWRIFIDETPQAITGIPDGGASGRGGPAEVALKPAFGNLLVVERQWAS